MRDCVAKRVESDDRILWVERVPVLWFVERTLYVQVMYSPVEM